MSDAGGQITHLGVIFQDKIAALFLGRMLNPRAEVDDVSVRSVWDDNCTVTYARWIVTYR